MTALSTLPSVGVIIPTHERPLLLAEALKAVAAQSYAGRVETVVVFDHSVPDFSVQRTGDRGVRVVVNDRTSGLAGARNTGILALETDLIAFCDDDDAWLPDKLREQVLALSRHGGAPFATTATEIMYGDHSSVRLAHSSRVGHGDLLRSRMSMLHSSTFLMRRDWLASTVGLVDEGAPGGQNEDWDLLLRVTEHGTIAHVDSPLVQIRWGGSSYFAGQWEARAIALDWILERHPDIADSTVGAARVYGQLAFAHAAMGHQRESLRWARRALRNHGREWRAVVAIAVTAGLVSPARVQHLLHRFGRGI